MRSSRLIANGLYTSAFCVLLLGGNPAEAIDYTWTPKSNVGMRLDDNIRGRERNGHGAWGFDTLGGIEFAATSDRLTSILYPRVNVRRFIIGENLDTEEYFVDFDNEYRLETVVSRLDFSFHRNSTLATEATDIGLFDQVTDRDSLSINPSADWIINDRWVAQASFLYNDVKYLDADNTGLIDYEYMSGSLGGYYAYDDLTQIFGTAFVTNFDTPDIGGKTRNYGVQAGVTRELSRSLNVTASIGNIWSDIEFLDQQLTLVFDPFPRVVPIAVDGDANTTGIIATVAIDKRYRNTFAEFDYSRHVSPTGRGAQGTTDDIKLRVAQQMSPRLTLVFVGKHEIRTTEGDLNNLALDRDLTSMTGEAHYRITENLTFVGRYRYRYRKTTRDANNPSTAGANALFLSIRYNGDPRNILDGF